MSRVTFVPRHVAENMSPPDPTTLLISLQHPGDIADVYHWEPMVIRLYFDDVLEQRDGQVAFDITMADELIEYVQLSGPTDIVVHCEAGLSRSAAVAKWLVDRMGYELWLHPKGTGTITHHNPHVYRILEAVTGNDMATYYQTLENQKK